MRKVEILAPAGSYESMVAAVSVGCDAVYAGGSRFGARAFAGNFTEEELKRAIDFMHLREKKLYLTVNTLLKEEELNEQLYSYLLPFYEQGLDAVIVQDMGALSFIHRNFPKLPIHASTQMSLTGSKGANGLKPFGVTRFVPARELSLGELRAIRRETDLEMEVFVHGALCYSYSGQCLLSSMMGGRSGNRGRCAQPCRLQYGLDDGNKGHFMSPKDICTLELLPELVEAGMDSFKLEGRMKKPEYAAFTSYIYGKYVDLYEALGKEDYERYVKDHSKEFAEDKRALMDLYNRGGFSQGYYAQYHGKSMMSVERPNHSGVLVGHVAQARKGKAAIRLNAEVHGQDILEFRSSTGLPIYEYTLKTDAKAGKEIWANVLPNSKIYSGMEVFRTRNQRLLGEIAERFLGSEPPVKLSGELRAVVGEPLRLVFAYRKENGEKITACAEGEKVQEAKNQPTSEERMEKAIMQMQDLGFVLEGLQVVAEGAAFVPIGKLKELRRECLARLCEAATSLYRRTAARTAVAAIPQKAEKKTRDKTVALAKGQEGYCIDASVLTKEQAEAVLAFYIDRIYLSYALYLECCQEGMDFSKTEVIFTLPHVIREKNRECLKQGSGQASASGFLLRNLEELFWFLEDTKRTNQEGAGTWLVLDHSLPIWNQEAERVYRALGAAEATASLELTAKELRQIGCQGNTLLVYGRVPLMVTAQCMAETTTLCRKSSGFLRLQGNKGKELLAYHDCQNCCNLIYDSTPISLLAEKERIGKLSPKRLRLDFTVEKKAEAEKILKAFLEVFRYKKEGKAFRWATTKGHFYKGVE